MIFETEEDRSRRAARNLEKLIQGGRFSTYNPYEYVLKFLGISLLFIVVGMSVAAIYLL